MFPMAGSSRGLKLMAGIPHGGIRGGSGSDGPHDTPSDDPQDARTYTLPTFAEATDVSEAMRERRADRNKSIAMRVLAAVLILTALGIGESVAIPFGARAGEHVGAFRKARGGLAIPAGR